MEKIQEVLKGTEALLNQFLQEEIGNRLSQFALLSLKSMILSEINKLLSDGNPANDPKKNG